MNSKTREKIATEKQSTRKLAVRMLRENGVNENQLRSRGVRKWLRNSISKLRKGQPVLFRSDMVKAKAKY